MDETTLLETYKTLLPWNLARIKCFVNMILGVLASGSIQQHKMALGFTGEVKPESICKRLRNFLKNFDLNLSDHARATLTLLGLEKRLTLVLDRTSWGFGVVSFNLLVLGVVVSDQLTIPLLWKALPKKGCSNAQEKIDLIGTFISRFGVDRIGKVIGDREFIGKAWIEFLMHHKIPFFIRIKENRLVEWGNHRCSIREFFTHLKARQKRYIEFELDGYRLFFEATRTPENDLVIVMSNQDRRGGLLTTYRKRWTIEQMFKHCKTNGFNIEDTHLRHLERIEKLLAVVCSALVICFLAGKREERKRPTPYKKTVKAPAFSTFRRGFDHLRRLLFYAKGAALQFIYTISAECLKNYHLNQQNIKIVR